MRFEKLAQSLRLPALAMFSVFLFACGSGDGPDEIVDPRFANCPGPDCVLNPVPPGPPPATANLLANGSFEGGSFLPWINAGSIVTDPFGGNNFYTQPVAAAGNAFDVNLSQALVLTDGDSYILNFRAKASVDRSIVVGIGEYGGGFAAALQFPELTTEWQGFSYVLVAPPGVTATGGRVLFDMGAEIGTVDIDDISLTPIADAGNELMTDGSFSSGNSLSYNSGFPAAAATGTVVVGEPGNANVYFVNVAAAGAPFNVNLSQVFTITPGQNYKVTFRARTAIAPAPSRTMLAGLGLNEPPFSADTQTVLLLNDWRSYTYTITPTFGNSNSRVLFDMGAAEGDVYIDDVFVSVEP